MDRISKCCRHELPVFLSVEVFNSVIGVFIRDEWTPVSTSYLSSVVSLISSFVKSAWEDTLHGFPHLFFLG
jgi:hypothetical protein